MVQININIYDGAMHWFEHSNERTNELNPCRSSPLINAISTNRHKNEKKKKNTNSLPFIYCFLFDIVYKHTHKNNCVKKGKSKFLSNREKLL